MIRGDTAFVRRLGREARRAWRKLPRSRRRSPARRAGFLTRRHSITRLRWAVPPLLFLLTGVPDLPLTPLFGFLALHTLLATLRQSASLVAELHEAPRLIMPFLLPLEDRAIFDAQTRAFRKSLLALAFDWLFLGFGMALWRHHPGWWIAAPLLAFAQAGFSGACALFFARLRPDARWAVIHTALCYLVGGIVLFGRHSEAVQASWPRAIELLRRCTPAGLFANGAHYAATQNALVFAWLGLVAVGTVGLAWRLERRWRLAYSTRFLEETPPETEPPRPSADDAIAPDDGLASTTTEARARESGTVAGDRPGHSAAFDNPHDREMLRRELRDRLDFDSGEAYARQGPVERVFAHLWSTRQRYLLALYGPPPTRWHRRLAIAVLVTVLTSLAASATGRVSVALVGAGMGFALLLPVWEQRWGVLWRVLNGPLQTAVHGYLPVSLYSIAGAYLSLAYAKILLAGALLALALAPWIGTAEALHYGALGCCLGLIWAPLAFMFSLSSGTNDSSARWWLSLLALGLVGLILFGGGSLIIVAFALDDSRAIAICAGLAVAGANALLGAYLWAAGRRWFDFMPTPKV